MNRRGPLGLAWISEEICLRATVVLLSRKLVLLPTHPLTACRFTVSPWDDKERTDDALLLHLPIVVTRRKTRRERQGGKCLTQTTAGMFKWPSPILLAVMERGAKRLGASQAS